MFTVGAGRDTVLVVERLLVVVVVGRLAVFMFPVFIDDAGREAVVLDVGRGVEVVVVGRLLVVVVDTLVERLTVLVCAVGAAEAGFVLAEV